MPRKTTAKTSLLFAEPPLRGARIRTEPDVRAAINPKPFFTESQIHNSTALNSWVSPQFDTLVTVAPPVRRGRREHNSGSTVKGSAQLPKKKTAHRFTPLLFERRSGGGSHPSEQTHRRKPAEPAVESGSRPQGPRQSKSVVWPKRRALSVRDTREGSASSGRRVDQPESSTDHVTERCSDASTPPPPELWTNGVCPPSPEVETPKVSQEGESHSSSTCAHFPLFHAAAPPCAVPPDVLVSDTPERDYGLKVTWRKRRDLMLLFKDRGHLSESDTLIHSSPCGQPVTRRSDDDVIKEGKKKISRY
ncbi:RAD9, HUS1, RAD1-interacting nuclear orphan protein 1 [Thalassophryne amazonica]|uniref:RAD9, HUS1, RAD1-interacting nuclear orphan protein 1 n=1 Tax=Thalassophryne amazonica TaxID=390379 RepID=UPI0014713AF2|nr:RAD9, HUS1, RAD1-interacting nuclear orphan protein 1 [Thalassophryne amazonica]